jgi:cytochrome P450
MSRSVRLCLVFSTPTVAHRPCLARGRPGWQAAAVATAEVTIDLLSPASFSDGQPHEQYRWLRDHAPVFRHPEPDGVGFWAVTRHEDVRAVGRDAAAFSSVPTTMIPDPPEGLGFGDHQMMLMSDPPHHTRLRRTINREFTPRAAERLRPRVRELATRIVDNVIERGECDFVADVAGEMPSFVIAELLGLPLDDGRRLYELTETIHAAPETQPEGAGMGAVLEMFNYAHDVAEQKRAKPADDLSTALLHAEVDGHALDDIDFNLFFLLLVDAGGDTTRNLLGGGLIALFEHPDQRVRLQRDLPGVLPTAVEEMLRWVSPVVHMRRTATRDIQLSGTTIAAGDKVVMYYGAANRDPAHFADPDRFDILRTRSTTWPSAAARTPASARTSGASRSRRCCARSSSGSPTSPRPAR